MGMLRHAVSSWVTTVTLNEKVFVVVPLPDAALIPHALPRGARLVIYMNPLARPSMALAAGLRVPTVVPMVRDRFDLSEEDATRLAETVVGML